MQKCNVVKTTHNDLHAAVNDEASRAASGAVGGAGMDSNGNLTVSKTGGLDFAPLNV